MKKLLSFLLLAAMLLSMSVVAMAEGETSKGSFELVPISVPESFTVFQRTVNGAAKNEQNISPANVLDRFGMLYNEHYCFMLDLKVENFSTSGDSAACFSVSADKEGVQVLVARYYLKSNTYILDAKTGGMTDTWTENPFTASGQRYNWFNALKNTGASTDSTNKLFIAVDPRTVTEATTLTVTAIERDSILDDNDNLIENRYRNLAYYSKSLDAYTQQTNTQITVGEGENAQTYTTLEAAVAADSTTTGTIFTVPANTGIDDVTVPANSTVTVTASESSGNVKVKEMSYNGENVSGTFYVITNGDNTTAISENIMSTKFDSNSSNAGADISDNINVAKVLIGAVSDGVDISSMTSMELSLAKDTSPQIEELTAKDSVKSTIGDSTIAVKAEVHPIVKITTGTGDQKTTITRLVSNEELKNATFTVSVSGFDKSKSYTIYHFGTDGNLIESFPEKTPNDLGWIYVDLSRFSYLLAVENGYADPASTEVIFYTMQGDFGNSYEFNVRLKVPDASYVPSLNLGGFRPLSASTPAEYAGSKVVAYTVSESSDDRGYYYNYQIKLFAKFLNTPIYFTVMHDNEAVAISPISGDTVFMQHPENTNYYGYSMADYVGLVSGSYPSYGLLFSYIRGYADSVLAVFPDKVSGT